MTRSSLDLALSRLQQDKQLLASFPSKNLILAILNGVIGDYLEETSNPLAIQMQLRGGNTAHEPGMKLPVAQSRPHTRKILLFVHGLCMNETCWQPNERSWEKLCTSLNYMPMYLRYNSGLHIAENGKLLSDILLHFLKSHHQEIDQLDIICHSMGGLVIRSALHYASEKGQQWPNAVQNIFYLGTPHHGAPMEKIGSYVQKSLDAIPYIKHFARLGKLRSAGITDLRYGHICESDWRGQHKYGPTKDNRLIIPLSEHINHYTFAAHLGVQSGKLNYQVLGDGLVQVNSALGIHKRNERSLNFPDTHKMILSEMGHFDLLKTDIIPEKIKETLAH